MLRAFRRGARVRAARAIPAVCPPVFMGVAEWAKGRSGKPRLRVGSCGQMGALVRVGLVAWALSSASPTTNI